MDASVKVHRIKITTVRGRSLICIGSTAVHLGFESASDSRWPSYEIHKACRHLRAAPLSLNTGRLNARDADLTSGTLAAAHMAKQQCINSCRARYRDCHRVNQLPSVGAFIRIASD